MMLKRRYNCVYRDYPPFRNGELVGVLSCTDEPDLFPWMGLIDRHAARRITGAREVSLDFVAYQRHLLDKTHWLADGLYVVGCLIPGQGVLGVTDGAGPLLKRQADTTDQTNAVQ